MPMTRNASSNSPRATGIVTYRMTRPRLIDTPECEAQRLRTVLANRG
jgi:hypothetical protein